MTPYLMTNAKSAVKIGVPLAVGASLLFLAVSPMFAADFSIQDAVSDVFDQMKIYSLAVAPAGTTIGMKSISLNDRLGLMVRWLV